MRILAIILLGLLLFGCDSQSTATETDLPDVTIETTFDPTKDIKINVYRPMGWDYIGIWYDLNSDESWETTELGGVKSILYPSEDRWSYRVFKDQRSMKFLFNDGSWNQKLDGPDSYQITTSGEYWIVENLLIHTEKPTGITLYVEKPKEFDRIDLWYNQNSDDIWETTELKSDIGLMAPVKTRPNFYKKTIWNTDKLTFLFNNGTWDHKLDQNGGDFVVTERGEYWITADGVLHTEDPYKHIIFNSRDLAYKTPFGAVSIGDSVTYRFKAAIGSVKSSKLIRTRQIIEGDRDIEYQPLDSHDMIQSEESGSDWWSTSLTYDGIGVYGYTFEITLSDDQIIYMGSSGTRFHVSHYNLPLTGGFAGVYREMPDEAAMIQSVAVKDFNAPTWGPDSVFYYIFPERFRNGDKDNDPKIGINKYYGNDVELHSNWLDPKPWVPGDSDGLESDDEHYCNDFYGGDLQGIIDQLDSLKELGINTLYLNPIFTAPSNHKYDCTDYHNIDPIFGDNKLFETLTATAKEQGIRVILDVSLNHSSSDSLYMDRFGKYDTLGAFEGDMIRIDSPYYDWYQFNPEESDPNNMYQFWGNSTLANLNDQSQSYQDFAFNGSDSVTQFWLNKGSSGWRMDVVPWVPDHFWRKWRTSVKSVDTESYTVAEAWWDSSKYLLGDMFDSTMNYPFRAAMLGYLNGEYSGIEVDQILEMLRENYPKEAFYMLMNLLSTHDRPRMLYYLGYKEAGDTGYDVAIQKLKLAFLFQFTYPGAPALYYGDEVGMTGGDDPFNRGPYPWKDLGGNPDSELRSFVRSILTLRKNSEILRQGSVIPLYSDHDVVIYLRKNGEEYLLTGFNRSGFNRGVVVTLPDVLAQKRCTPLPETPANIDQNKATLTIQFTPYQGVVAQFSADQK